MNKNKKLIVFTLGIILSVVYFYLFKKMLINKIDILKTTSIQNLQSIKINNIALLKYVLQERITQTLIILLCTCSAYNIILLYGVFVYLGFHVGLLLMVSVYNYSFMGILLCIVSLFPHGIFYGLFLIEICKVAGYDDGKYYNKGKTIIICLLYYVIGILSESFINPTIFHSFSLLF